MPGACIANVIDYIDYCHFSNTVLNIIFLIGSNDSSNSPYIDYTRSQYNSLIEKCHLKFPNAVIKFVKLLPRKSNKVNSVINRINNILYDVCKQYTNVIFLDHYALFYDFPAHFYKIHLYQSSTHLNATGCRLLSAFIRNNLPKVQHHSGYYSRFF
ncbi:hypothetical protein SNE40_009541 [Patella caerulea]|uniref:SGNH hydrolase-type esterase domain-containing protein n=1 Tax=Patella caerulea TaxID=87958 RepID=A0AAN8PYL9_PATCE